VTVGLSAPAHDRWQLVAVTIPGIPPAVTFPTGDARIPWIAAADIGAAAAEVFLRGDALIYDSIGIAGDHLSGGEMAAQLSAALGEHVAYNPVSPDAFSASKAD